jgi:oligoendopeptidase F
MPSDIPNQRPSEEFPRRYVPAQIDLGEWNEVEPLLQKLSSRFILSAEELEAWLMDLSELQACLYEEGSRRYIDMTCHTDDETIEKAYLHFIGEINPKLKPHWDFLNRKYLETQASHPLDMDRYKVFTRALENEVRLFREENVPLQTEDDILSQRYQKICGAMTAIMEGEEKTLPQMRRYLEETNRSARQEAWEKISARYLADREAIDSIYDEEIQVRHQIARNAGFVNYRDYQHQALGRFDYSPQDCHAFHEAIEQEIVPLAARLAERRGRNLQLAALRPWDLQVDPKGRPPLRPFEKGDQLAAGCERIFSKIESALGDQFRQMQSNGLLDLESRKGKAPGGYQSNLEEIRLPFIFMNAAGTDQDLFTLLHEGGHAFHTFACRNEPLLAYRDAPIEFCEVASMGMELLSLPHFGEFYSEEESARSRTSHLEKILQLLPWIATIDAFQHWIYQNPGHSQEERREEWLSLQRRFGPAVDWSGYEEAECNAWHKQLHLFSVPFYYIEYGIAQLGALQLWRAASDDGPAALARYRAALALGGSRPLPELFATAGLRFSLGRNTVAPLARKLAEELNIS